MRQFLFGLSCAALGLWAWSSWSAAEGAVPDRPPGSPASDRQAGEVDLGTLMESRPGGPRPLAAKGGAPGGGLAGSGAPDEPAPDAAAAAEAGAGAGAAGAAGEPTRDQAIEAAFQRLVAQIEAGDAAARGLGLRVLGRDDLWPEHRARLRELLGPALAPLPADLGFEPAAAEAAGQSGETGREDVAAALSRLGRGNGFLHSAEGRRLGERVLVLLSGLEDGPATAAGTELLARCMQGPITPQDAQARAFVDEAYRQHRLRADRHLCDPADLTRARSYEVREGDSLGAIARRFQKEGIAVEQGALAVLNRIHNANAIQIGQRIRVPIDPIHAVVEKRSFLMAVYLGDQVLRLYWVGHGADGKTPVARFTVGEKLENPTWYAPDGRVVAPGDPENILGRFFIKFHSPSYTGFGAHGTPMPETIGTMSSMGCIRMYDKDIAELFQLLPRGAVVEIRDSH